MDEKHKFRKSQVEKNGNKNSQTAFFHLSEHDFLWKKAFLFIPPENIIIIIIFLCCNVAVTFPTQLRSYYLARMSEQESFARMNDCNNNRFVYVIEACQLST
jgi:hypothetical protein